MMRYRRWSDRDNHLGPHLLVSRDRNYRPLAVVLDSGDSDEHPGCNLRLSAFGWTAILELPQIIKPWQNPKESWDRHRREFGFSLNEGFLRVFLGPQTHSSETTKTWSKFLPWTQWRHVRFSLYDAEGRHFWTQLERDRKRGGMFFEEQRAAEADVPKLVFLFDDYDGKRITATTHIEEREWRFGEGWFQWLSLFRKPRIRRSLSLAFSEEVGPEKGSWKGGTTGHGIEMLPGELHEAAFRRYCEQEHRSKYQRFHLTFVGAA